MWFLGGWPARQTAHKKSGNSKLGDEFHFLFECKPLSEIPNRYLNIDDIKIVNTFSFHRIMNVGDNNVLFQLAKFIIEGFKLLKKVTLISVYNIVNIYSTVYIYYILYVILLCIVPCR